MLLIWTESYSPLSACLLLRLYSQNPVFRSGHFTEFDDFMRKSAGGARASNHEVATARQDGFNRCSHQPFRARTSARAQPSLP